MEHNRVKLTYQNITKIPPRPRRPTQRVGRDKQYAPTNRCTQFWHWLRVIWKCFEMLHKKAESDWISAWTWCNHLIPVTSYVAARIAARRAPNLWVTIFYAQFIFPWVYIHVHIYVYIHIFMPYISNFSTNSRYYLSQYRPVALFDINTVYPKKYAHGFCFAVLCCGYTLTDFPISIRLTSLALWQSNDCPSTSKATLMNMDEYFMWIHYERLHNHNKAKHNKTVCIFLGIYCIYANVWYTYTW